MNNIINTFKRFIQNKNTVTILGVIIIIAILYFGYNSQIQKQVSPIKGVPIARHEIPPKTEITVDMLDDVDIPPIVMQKGAITESSLVIGKYTNHNTMIPEGSLFYEGVLVRKEDLPDAAFEKVKEGEEVVKMAVSTDSTYGNAIFPGNKIDIYMKAESLEGLIMVGKLFENIEIVDVKDSSGQHVFEDATDSRSPSMMIFGLKPEYSNLFWKAEFLNVGSVELFPVPHGKRVKEEEGEVTVIAKKLEEFIHINSEPNPELIEVEEIEDEVEDDIPNFEDLDFIE